LGLEREVFRSDAEFLASDASGSDGAAAPQPFLSEDVEISIVASAPALRLVDPMKAVRSSSSGDG
jgi:hypothetical protein